MYQPTPTPNNEAHAQPRANVGTHPGTHPDDDVSCWRRAPCRRCNGKGFTDDSRAYCPTCYHSWTTRRLAGILGARWRPSLIIMARWPWTIRLFGLKLPCGHRVHTIEYYAPRCHTCHGFGWIEVCATSAMLHTLQEAAHWQSWQDRLEARGWTPVPWQAVTNAVRATPQHSETSTETPIDERLTQIIPALPVLPVLPTHEAQPALPAPSAPHPRPTPRRTLRPFIQ